jgi:hypothetical protein
VIPNDHYEEDRTVRTTFISVAIAAVAAAAAANASASGTAFKSNVCRLVSPAQIARIPALSSNCANAAPTQAPGATLYTGNWSGSPALQLTVAAYTDRGALQRATRNLKQGLPAAPHRVTGIGTAAYTATGANATGVHFTVGKYVAYLTLAGVTGKAATAQAETLAKSIVQRLR